MNNKEFISELSNRIALPQEETKKIVASAITAMAEYFEAGESVQITGFGTFEVKKRMERIMVNPATGQRMLVPPKLVLNFRPNAATKEKIKKGGSE